MAVGVAITPTESQGRNAATIKGTRPPVRVLERDVVPLARAA